jgi:formyltetrahydrofolate synthetase
VLIVIEPTMSGLHNLDRRLALTNHFPVPASVCLNKWDIAAEKSAAIERHVRAAGVRFAGRIRDGHGVTDAQMRAATVAEAVVASAGDIRAVRQKPAGQPAFDRVDGLAAKAGTARADAAPDGRSGLIDRRVAACIPPPGRALVAS